MDSLVLFNNVNLPDSKLEGSYILTYLQMNCPGCIKDIYNWVNFTNRFEELRKTNIVFILTGEPSEFTYHHLTNNKSIKFPIFWDQNNAFLNTNGLMVLEFEKTIFVGEDSTILLMGNPLYDGKMLKKYLYEARKQ